MKGKGGYRISNKIKNQLEEIRKDATVLESMIEISNTDNPNANSNIMHSKIKGIKHKINNILEGAD